jgi:hypothetical protein
VKAWIETTEVREKLACYFVRKLLLYYLSGKGKKRGFLVSCTMQNASCVFTNGKHIFIHFDPLLSSMKSEIPSIPSSTLKTAVIICEVLPAAAPSIKCINFSQLCSHLSYQRFDNYIIVFQKPSLEECSVVTLLTPVRSGT